MTTTTRADRPAVRPALHMPAEWSPHEATWVAWPSHAELWQANVAPARIAFAKLVEGIAAGERVEVLVPDDAQERLARAALGTKNVRFRRQAFGDIWLRDTAPIFLVAPGGELATVRFAFNGWGGKYVLDDDDTLSARIAADCGVAAAFAEPLVLEGGAVDVDGEGTILTTRQCLLNPNRNPTRDAAEIERVVLERLGAEKLLWLGDGLTNDHTDGHIDTIVRFVAPGVVVAMEARGPNASDDPNRAILDSLLSELGTMVDARGRKLEIVRLPSPGRIEDEDGRVMPASYVNFYIANASVVVPTYGSPFDDAAVDAIAALFPRRRTFGVDARAILSGGGAFHCITQQQPRRSEGT